MSEFEQTPEKESVDQQQRLRHYIYQLLTDEVTPSSSLINLDIQMTSGGVIVHGNYAIDNDRLLVAELIDISDCFAADGALIEPEYQLRLAIHDTTDGSCEYEFTIDEHGPLGESSRSIATYMQGGAYYDYAENDKMGYFDGVIANFFEQFEGIIPPEVA